jgi:hypothetical protein
MIIDNFPDIVKKQGIASLPVLFVPKGFNTPPLGAVIKY